MIELKPEVNHLATCPECGCDNVPVKEILFPGIHVLGDCKCPECSFEFYQDLPTGHGMHFCISLGKNNGRLYNFGEENANAWFGNPLLKASENKVSEFVNVEVRVNEPREEVIILNTLDSYYGHTLLKLFSAQRYLDNADMPGLILIIPREFENLIPEGCAEVWIIDINIRVMEGWYEGLDRAIKQELKRFEKVYLSPAVPHPDYSKIDISRFSSVKPFNLDEFYDRPPYFTFVIREDKKLRIWFSNKIDHYLSTLCTRFKLTRVFWKYFLWKQYRAIKKTMRLLRKVYPDAEFAVTGFGKFGSFEGYANDYRITKPDPEYQTEYWFKTFAKSHVVIGVTGSNMFMPSAHAAGCIDIVYPFKLIGNVQDLFVRYYDVRQLFFYRYVYWCIKPWEVAKYAEAIVRDYKNFDTMSLTDIKEFVH